MPGDGERRRPDFPHRGVRRASHASTREAGVSAIDAYLPVHQALADLEVRRDIDPDPLMVEYPIPYALSVGVLRGGDWASSVPGSRVAEGRLGVRLGEDPAEEVAEAATAWSIDHIKSILTQ